MFMRTVKVRGVELGAGVPKTIVPIVARTREAILDKAREICGLPADLVEWRADFYENLLDEGKLLDTLKALRGALGDMPLLFTVRTKPEGGEVDIAAGPYSALNIAVAKSGDADMVDVEIEKDGSQSVIDGVHKAGCMVVGSKHDFKATPPKDDMVATLTKARDMGADIPKIAVMPNSAHDVVMLLCASTTAYERIDDRPILTISMGPRGMISRVACELSGSCMTFGAAGQTSAPGQIQVKDLKDVLSLIHRAQGA
jgi:3-dehydroquinate dehydratase-1